MLVDERVLDFIGKLRGAGVQISIAESRDALEALGVVPLDGIGTLRDSLKATLIKNETDYPIFEIIFDDYFTGSLSMLTVGEHEEERPEGQGEFFAFPDSESLSAAFKGAIIDGTDEDIAALARMVAVGIGEMEGGFGAGSRPIGLMAGPGYYLFRAMELLNFRDVAALLENLAAEGELYPDMPPVLARDRVAERLERFSAALEREIKRRLAKERGHREVEKKKLPPRPEEIDFTDASLRQIEQMRRILPALARRLAARLARKKDPGKRGRVDIRNTLRHSISCGGVPIEVKYRKRVPAKPELFILCDVSGSVKTFSTFTLNLVYSLHQQFRSVRSFAFIDRVDEVTEYFNRYDINEAVEKVYRNGVVVDGDGHSDIGRALDLFSGEFNEELTPRATVLILSDARNNNRDPRARALERVGEKVRRVYWLNPEPRERWNTGDSVMDEYADHCNSVHECRNLKQLAEFVYRGVL